jgi:DUF4097 and DUF4098 domain-containing protein YvlB
MTGAVDMESLNGPVSLYGGGGRVHARTTNGPVSVVLSGARWEGEGLDAETENGPVTLVVPTPYSGRLEASTVNGPMHVVPPFATVGGRVEATLGEGGAPLRVRTVNGPLAITRP